MSTTGADSTEDVAARDEIGFNVVASGPDYRGIRQALGELFAGDGSVVLVSGYFTYNGFLGIKDDIEAFLSRSPENELVVVVGTASDQFSPRIATDLWELDPGDRVRIYKYPLGLHAKLYLRDGPNPRMILTSANITQVGFRYNVELGIEFAAEGGDHPDPGYLILLVVGRYRVDRPTAWRSTRNRLRYTSETAAAVSPPPVTAATFGSSVSPESPPLPGADRYPTVRTHNPPEQFRCVHRVEAAAIAASSASARRTSATPAF